MAGRPALLKGARGASGDGNWFGGTGGDGAGGAEPGAMESGAAGEPGGASLSPMSPLYWSQPSHDPEPPETPAPRKEYRATPATTRSKAKAAEVLRSGVANTGLPGAFALLSAEEEMVRTMGSTHIPDPLPPNTLVTDMPTPKTDSEANSGQYRKHFALARESEMSGHSAARTFVELQPGE